MSKFKITALLLFMLSTLSASSQIKEYYVTCDPAELENIFENFSEDIYIPVTMTHDGVTIDDVRMRIRGDGTRVFRKKSLKFKFDSEPFFDGRDVVNFNAEFEDRSYLRQHLATRLFKLSGQVCYSTEYARLYINDKFMGLFLIIENVGEQFLEANDMNKNCNIYKATYDGACLSVWDGVFFHWEKKINENGDRDDLTQFIKGINEVPDEDYKAFISDKMNYDEMLNIIAMNIMLVNSSTYYHNYYMYHDLDTDKWSYLPWDTDKTFSKFGSGVMYLSNRAKPSNPLFHRAMMVEEVFADVQKRIEEISTDFFNNDYLQAVRDSLVEVLRPSVLEDDQDDIPDEEEWLKRVDQDHHFIKNRFNLISKQYGEVPKMFKVIPSNEVFTGDVTLRWHPAVSPNGSDLQYKIYHSMHLQMLKDVEETELFDDTTYTFKAEDLEERTYYWYVVCYDGKYEVWGIDNFNYFTYKTGTKPACEILKNTTFTKAKSPYIIENCNLTIKPGVKLTVEAGAEIRLADTSDIVILGEMICLGTDDEPISIRTIDSPNNNHRLIFKDATGINKFNYVNFDEVKFFSTVSDLEISNCNFMIDENISEDDIFKIYEGDWTFRNNIVRSNGTGEGIVLSYSDAITEGNEFYNCPDAVEYITVEDGLIRGNLIVNSPDDAIDLNGCQNIIVDENHIIGSVDKGISIGHDVNRTCTDIIVRRNIIEQCRYGLTVKSESTVLVENNIFYNNDISINCYKYFEGKAGGMPTIVNCIIAGSKEDAVRSDAESIVKISYSLCDTDVLEGEGNINADPKFKDAPAGDFTLADDSPCINSGDPASKQDPDGTRADIGVFPSNQSSMPIVINEINYNNSPDFDPEDWVEFYNPAADPVDISGWYFSDDNDANHFVFPEGTEIAAKGYFVLCKERAPFSELFPNVHNISGDMGFGLSSGGEHIRLFNAQGEIIDSLTYDDKEPWPEEADGSGNTLELIDSKSDNALPESWADSGEVHGTPGKLNSVSIGSEEITNAGNCSLSNYPNPFSESTIIKYYVPELTAVTLELYNSTGRKLATLLNQAAKGIGEHTIAYDKSLPRSGTYFLRMRTSAGESLVIPIVIIR